MLNSLTPVDGSELLLVNQDGRTVLVNRPQAVTILALGGAMSRPGKSLLTERTGTERFQALQGGNMIEMSLVDLTAYLAGTATPGIVPANRAADFFTGRERFMIHQGTAVAAGDISQTLYIRGTGGSLQGLGGNFPVDGGPVPLGIYGSPGSAILNASAAFTPTISGGTGPYTLSVVSGALPAGVTRSGNSLTGTYTTAGAFNYTLRATDSSNPAQTADLLVSGTVAAAGGGGGTLAGYNLVALRNGSTVAVNPFAFKAL